ncbi:MAG: flagellar biosynthetic protein FliO [Firmicutes bacterium]|nr:flagellar biosynthetic protein FliO [Bacillota bacterium]
MNDNSFFLSFIKLLIALPIVVILAYISLRLSNKYLMKYNKGKNMKIIEKIPLHNKSSLCIAKLGEKYVVLGVSENNIQVLTELSENEIKECVKDDGEYNFKEALLKNYKKLRKGMKNR